MINHLSRHTPSRDAPDFKSSWYQFSDLGALISNGSLAISSTALLELSSFTRLGRAVCVGYRKEFKKKKKKSLFTDTIIVMQLLGDGKTVQNFINMR